MVVPVERAQHVLRVYAAGMTWKDGSILVGQGAVMRTTRHYSCGRCT